MEKVYNGYWKTDVENKKLKTKQEEALDRIKKLEESLRKEGTVLGNMIKAMQDPRLAAAEQSKRQQQVQTKQKELQQMQDAIRGFRERTQRISSWICARRASKSWRRFSKSFQPRPKARAKPRA